MLHVKKKKSSITQCIRKLDLFCSIPISRLRCAWIQGVLHKIITPTHVVQQGVGQIIPHSAFCEWNPLVSQAPSEEVTDCCHDQSSPGGRDFMSTFEEEHWLSSKSFTGPHIIFRMSENDGEDREFIPCPSPSTLSYVQAQPLPQEMFTTPLF